MSTASTPLSRIVERRLAELEINPFEADRRGNLSKGFVNDILIGRKRNVRTDNAKKLAKALDMPMDVLMDPDRVLDFQPTLAVNDRGRHEGNTKAGVLIPEIDVRGGAGYGGGVGIEVYTRDARGEIVSSDATRGEWMIPDYFLASGNMRASRTHVLAVDGPSMMPDLNPTDRVVVDLDDQNPGSDGIFAVWDGDTQSVILKNVQVVRGTDPPRIKCISSNTTYEPFEVILDGASRIIGRVKYRITAV